MILLYIAIVLLSMIGIGLRHKLDGEQALSIQQCNAIKGISILLVFVSHACGYIDGSGYSYNFPGDRLFLTLNRMIGQLCVVMFLFYSGYGTELSILKKGDDYVNRIPRRRCLTTLLNFDVAVIVFLLVNLLLGRPVALSKFCLSLVGWDSIGNSNWYIFDIILCYFISFVSAKVTSNPQRRFKTILVLSLMVIGVLSILKSEEKWWYDTILVYPVGAFVALNKDRFFKMVRQYYKTIVFCTFLLLCIVVSFALLILNGQFHVLTYNVTSVLFAVLILLITMRVKVQNAVLLWLGTNLFPLYIYQCLPMLIISETNPSFVASHAILFCAVCFAVTVLIAWVYRYLKITID